MYLTPEAREKAAPALYAALQEAKGSWEAGLSKAECIQRASSVVQHQAEVLVHDNIEMKLDYIEMNDPETFEVLPEQESRTTWETETTGRPVVLSGAMWVGKTRLIDNVIIGDAQSLGILSN